MQLKRQTWLAIGIAGALLLSAHTAWGQTAAFPTLKGDNSRTGKNFDSTGSGPGHTNLRWFHPNSSDSRGASIIVDNDTLTQSTNGTSTGANGAATLNDTTQAWVVNQWINHTVSITGGTGAGQQGLITGNTATTLTVAAAWTTVPDNTSTYSINWVSTGANTASTLNDTAQAWTANQWQNHLVSITAGTGAGQQRLISSNTATTLTLSNAWTVTPDNTSVYGITVASFTGSWIAPPADQEAGNPYIPAGASDFPAYQYVASEASGAVTALPAGVGTSNSGSTLDPRVTLASESPGPGTISTTVATYTITPTDNVPRSYALSAWIPQGPTGNSAAGFTFPQNHFVYEIDYGNGQVFVDVFDTRIQGSGWVQLGNGGNKTNIQFPYDGIHPIVIKLFNTTPRGSAGNLLDPTGTSIVYADAFKADPAIGQIQASPTIFSFNDPVSGNPQQRVVSATNVYGSAVVNGQPTTSQIGVVSSYDVNGVSTGPLVWSWSPGGGSVGGVVDNLASSPVVTQGATSTFGSATAASGFYQTDYFAAPITNTLDPTDYVEYAPTIPDGSYDIYVWLAGDSNGQTFGHATQFEILEGPNPANTTTVTLDESVGGGWVKLGNRKFANLNATSNPLAVRITNYSADPGDATRTAYADAVWFVGTTAGTVVSTPVSANAHIALTLGATPGTQTPVTVVCAEDGRIYCLDAMGSGGTTKVYWTYPSIVPSSIATFSAAATPYAVGAFAKGSADGVAYRCIQATSTDPSGGVDPADWELADPNQVAAHDGPGPTAEMPTGFDISTAIIQNVGGQERLYIGATNGRVYCIDMTGRGDMNTAAGVPGTTTRLWSYPNDYPSAVPSTLGPFKGSLATNGSNTPWTAAFNYHKWDRVLGSDNNTYVSQSDGNLGNDPTTSPASWTVVSSLLIYAGTSQGRMYALDAVGNSANRVTTVTWRYPGPTDPTIGAITTTPAVDFGNVYFGTAMSNNGSSPGVFYALDQGSGNLVWSMNSTTVGASTVTMDNFLGGPATASAGELGGSMPDTVFVTNENRYIFGLDAQGSGGSATILWQTNELNSGVAGTLTYTQMFVTDNTGGSTLFPILLVPTEDGRFDGLFCRTGDLNKAGTRRAYEYRSAGDVSASIAVGLGWMVAADLSGNLYAFNDGSGFVGGPAPGGVTQTENAPPGPGPDFSAAKIRFITQAAYQRLRANPITDTFANVDSGADDATSTGFEWGQTLYAIVYNFPYALTGQVGSVTPPIVSFSLSIEGATLRQISAESRLFPDRTTFPPDLVGGYAMLPFTIQGSGANAMPPGNGKIAITISSGANSADGSSESYTVTPTGTSTFSIANPLALVMQPYDGASPIDSAPGNEQIGDTQNPTDPDNLVNGSPDVGGVLKSLLTSSTGVVAHGQTGSAKIAVVDRSLMTIMRGPDHGLDQVRVSREDLVWNKGFLSGGVAKPLPTASPFNSTFEDLPVNFPNNSLDYPDIRRAVIKVTKDPNGSPENPLFNPVQLNPPQYPAGQDLNSNPSRTLEATPFVFEVDVPKYQPYNDQQDLDSRNDPSNKVDAGYKGQVVVFVDSTGSGVFDLTAVHRQAYRAFNLAASVSKDERLSVGTPIVDLGSLPSGTGFSPVAPWAASGSTFSPFTGPYKGLFQPFVVKNEGNVNLLNLRLAHGTIRSGDPTVPWQILAPANEVLGWLDGVWNLWSDIDDVFYGPNSLSNPSPLNLPQVILQKPRPGDIAPTQLSVDPFPRANPNLGVTGGPSNPLVPGGPVGPPHVAVTIPLGFPSGTYVSTVRVIEDTSNTRASSTNPLPDQSFESLDLDTSNVPTESYTDPSFTLKFTVRESQLTNTYSPLTAPMVDDLIPSGTPPLFTYQNVQPTAARDATGNLLMAWASDRRDESTKDGVWAPALPTQADVDPRLRIYISTVQGNNPSSFTVGSSPLNDLNAFVPDPASGPTPTRWFQHQVGPFPSGAVDSLFGAGANEVIPATAQFHYPSLPAMGFVDPLDPTNPSSDFTSGVTMAFIGDAQIQKSSGNVSESRLFATTVTTDSSGNVTTTAPVSLDSDIYSAKGRPSVVQFAGNAVIFYPGAGTGEGVLNWVTFDGTNFSEPAQVPLPAGFESVGATSAVARVYSGANTDFAGKPIIDLAFTGKLRGRANSEVYMGRFIADGTPTGTPNGMAYLPVQTAEVLSRETEPGLFRSLGVAWNLPQTQWNSTTAYVRNDAVTFNNQYFICVAASSTNEQPDLFPASWQSIFNLYYLLNGTVHDLLNGDVWSASITYDLGARVVGSDGKPYVSSVSSNTGNDPTSTSGFWSLAPTSRVPTVDPASGLITAETSLGRVYLDPSLGTVRFATAAPNPSAQIGLTYQPQFTRVSTGTASGYSMPSLLFDNRFAGDINYWMKADNSGFALPSDTTLRSARYIATYGRAAAGSGQAARPFMTSMRLGVKLQTAIATGSDGSITSLTVTGNTGDYQVDPSQGKLYFTTADEDQAITVNYTGVDASGNPIPSLTFTGSVGMVVERAEAPMPLDQAVNESNVTTFIDPFDGIGGTPGPNQRPNLFWVFWSSTRGGGSDLFFQTLAPRFAPLVGAK